MTSVRAVIHRWTVLQWFGACTACFAAIGFLLFQHTLRFGFMDLDDPLLILENPAIQSFSWAHLRTIFTTYDPELYIPLTFLSYQFDIAVGGLHPFMIHLHSLVDHIADAALVTALCWVFLKNRKAAFVAGLLFLIHPIHIEATLWASGRKDLLATTFFFLALFLYEHGRHRERPTLSYVGSIVSFLLGLLSKVTVVTLPVILLLSDWLQGRKFTRQSLTRALPYFLLSIIFGIVALFGKSDAPSLSIIDRLLITARSLTFSLQKIVLPIHLSPIYLSEDPLSLTSPIMMLSVLVVIGLLAAMILLRRWRIVSYSIAFVIITYLPSFHNLVKGGEYYLTSDRYSSIPFFGIALLVGALVVHLDRSKKSIQRLGYGIIALVIVLLSILTRMQTMLWSSSAVMGQSITQTTPQSQLGHLWYGNALHDEGKPEEALVQYDAALAIANDAQVHYDRALAEEDLGKMKEALEDYRAAIALKPDYALAHINLGRMLYEQGKKTDARKAFVTANTLAPQLAMPLYNLGVLEGEAKHWEKAADFYRSALERDPLLSDARANLAVALLRLGKTAEGVEQLKQTLIDDPENPTARAVMQQLIMDGIVQPKQ